MLTKGSVLFSPRRTKDPWLEKLNVFVKSAGIFQKIFKLNSLPLYLLNGELSEMPTTHISQGRNSIHIYCMYLAWIDLCCESTIQV